ncbi:ATP synthase subunit C [uncultured Treponema sp.]|uniref:ATP synthase subunit C n=1 Tax=uncultured Treponema sp. TaxID=162155 RepID=UPI0025D8AA5C|nr:ATP synthase subunit C [uncultured Treponema sp.]
MNKKLLAILAVLAGLSVFSAAAQDAAASQNVEAAASTQSVSAQTEVAQAEKADSSAIKYIAAGLAVGIACIAGGMAVGKIGAAAMGAMSENAELSGKALPFVGLAEGICLWGFLVALLIIIL